MILVLPHATAAIMGISAANLNLLGRLRPSHVEIMYKYEYEYKYGLMVETEMIWCTYSMHLHLLIDQIEAATPF